MIPDAKIEPYIGIPLPPDTMPDRDDVTEEGFGGFRGTWFIGRSLLEETEDLLRYEGEVIDLLDRSSETPEDFERFANAVEGGEGGDLPDRLSEIFASSGLAELADWDGDLPPLQGLEIGVAGLIYALSSIRCLTAASCRSHVEERSWSDCPVVFFAAPGWRAQILADLVSSADCGMDAERGMLKIFGSSIRKTHGLARLIVEERGRFRTKPDPPASTDRTEPVDATQLDLFEE